MVWLNRAQQVTGDVISDAPRLSKAERALILARLADLWWRDDQERARGWAKHAVDSVAPLAGESVLEAQCRLAAARTILSVLSRRDAELNKRLLAVMSDTKQNQDPKIRAENASAILSAALAVVGTDPEKAETLAESSLSLAPSIRLGQLLWRLHAASPPTADKLFLKIKEVALLTSDVNLFSLLFTAVTQGPFASRQYKTQVLVSLTELLARTRKPEAPAPCNIIILVSPLLSSAEGLVPEHAQLLKESFALCRKSSKPEESMSPELDVNLRIDELLQAADKAGNSAERARYFARAVQLAAEAKNFQKALAILDSMDDEIKMILGASWSSWRWDYAASAACVSRNADNLQATQKLIDDSPLSVRGPVRIALVLNCDSLTPSEVTQLLNSARTELPKTEPSEQFSWFLALVRLYGKHLPESAPVVFVEAVNALNRAPNDSSDLCASSINQPTVLTSQMMLNQYMLPSVLWNLDESGMLSAVGLVESSEKKAALRLNLISVALAEHRKLQEQKKPKAS